MRAYVAWIALLLVSYGLPGLARGEEAVTVSVCAVAAAPLDFDRKLLRVEGVVDHQNEGFTISDPACPYKQLWLEYGGKIGSDTAYCCGDMSERERKEPLTVDGIETQLVDDKLFRHFDRIIRSAYSVTMHAVVEGHFFASKRPKDGPAVGYGHFGSFSMLVIERVHEATRLTHSKP